MTKIAVIAFVVTALLCACRSSDELQRHRDISLQVMTGTRAEPFFGETTLRVPTAYLVDEHNLKGHLTPLGAVRVGVGLPELGPLSYTAAVKSQAEWARYVELSLTYGHCFGLTSSLDEWLESWGERVNKPTFPQFEEFKLGRPRGSLRTMYVRREGLNRSFIECSDTDRPRRCKGMTDYDGLIALEYQFDATHLEQSEAIETGLRKLVASFVVKNNPVASMPIACRRRTQIVP